MGDEGTPVVAEAERAIFALGVDHEGIIDLAEGSALHAFGLRPREIIGSTFSSVFRNWPTLLEGAVRATNGEPRIILVRASERQFEVRCERRESSYPTPDGVLILAFDVTSQQAERDAARLREEQIALVFRQIPVAIWATDRELRITYVLGRPRPDVGLDANAIVGSTVYDIVGTRNPADSVVAHHLSALEGHRGRLRRAFGRRYYDVVVEPLRDGAGGILGCVGAAFDVTEQRKAEQELALSEARLAEAQRVAHVGSWEWDVETSQVVWSDELYRIHGIPKSELRGGYEEFLARVHPSDREIVTTAVFNSFRTMAPFSYEHRIIRSDKTIRWLHTRGEVISRDGKVVRIIGICQDTTELRSMTRKLEESLSMLRATFEATAEGILVVDREGVVVAFNPAFLSMWRIPADLAERREDRELLDFVASQLETPEEFLHGVRELYEAPERESFDVLHFKDGRVFERYAKPQRAGDKVFGRVWCFRDVTERERQLKRATFLADATRLLASLDIEAALAAVVRLAVPYLGNAGTVDLFGDGPPRRLLTVSGTEDLTGALELHPSVFAGHTAVDKIDATCRLSIPLLSKSGPLGALTFARGPGGAYADDEIDLAEDLAQRCSLAVENAKLYRRAEHALRARDELLAVAAHEIRGPLTAVHLAAQTLAEGVVTSTTSNKLLRIIEREDRRIARFVDELLDVSRIRAGRVHLELEEVDLGSVVRDVVSRLDGDTRFVVRTEGVAVGHWDRSRLDQVVTNLLSNAVKFGRGKPVDVSVRSRDGRVQLIVRDYGIGIDLEKQEQIWKPFERAVSGREYGGLGLGLYIVRAIVESMGGSVHVESQPAAGATFIVELPPRWTP